MDRESTAEYAVHAEGGDRKRQEMSSDSIVHGQFWRARQDRAPTFGCGGAALGYPRNPWLKDNRRHAGDPGLALSLCASVVMNRPSNQSVLPIPASLMSAASTFARPTADKCLLRRASGGQGVAVSLSADKADFSELQTWTEISSGALAGGARPSFLAGARTGRRFRIRTLCSGCRPDGTRSVRTRRAR